MGKGRIQVIEQQESNQKIVSNQKQHQKGNNNHEASTKPIKKKHKNKDKIKNRLIKYHSRQQPLLEKISKNNEKKQNPSEKLQPQRLLKSQQEDQAIGQKTQKKEIKQTKHSSQRQVTNKLKSLKHLAICFPDSILELPQTSTLRAYFMSQIARICSIFKVDEIIILRDTHYKSKSENFTPSEYLARNLQYLQTPQYLRKYLFKMHPDLQNVGLMNPIQSQHHLKADEVCQFREGVALDRPSKKGKGSWVDVGLKQQVQIEELVLPQTRLTVRIKNYKDEEAGMFEGQPVSKVTPKIEKGMYWGYDVRIAEDIQGVLLRGQQGQDYSIKICCYGHKSGVNSKHSHLKALDQFKDLEVEGESMLLFYPGTEMNVEGLDLSEFEYSFQFQNIGVKQLRLEEQIFISLSKLRQQYL